MGKNDALIFTLLLKLIITIYRNYIYIITKIMKYNINNYDNIIAHYN